MKFLIRLESKMHYKKIKKNDEDGMKEKETLSKITRKLEDNHHKQALKKRKKEYLFTIFVLILILVSLGVLFTFYLGI